MYSKGIQAYKDVVKFNQKQPHNTERPPLKASYKQKTNEDYAYVKNWIDYCLNRSVFNDGFHKETFKELKILYDVANGNIDKEWFNHVTNPYNTKREELKKYPATLEMYNLIYSNIRLLLGEKDNRPFNYHVITTGDGPETEREQEIKNNIRNNLEQMFINVVNQSVDTGYPSEEAELPEETKKRLEQNFKDSRSVQGQRILKYMIQNNRFKEILIDLFYDWLVAGVCYTYTYVQNKEVKVERVSPFDIDYSRDGDPDYVEDADWVIRRQRMSANQILDRFWDVIDTDELDYIDSVRSGGSMNPYYTVFRNHYTPEERNRPKQDIEVYHVQFRCFAKFGIVTYIDDFGEPQEFEVDEDFTLDNIMQEEFGMTLRWYWENEVWEGFLIDNRIYLDMGPITDQRGEISNKAESKLSYNGKYFSSIHSKNTSPVKLGLSLQKLYIIIFYRMELAIAKSRGKIAVMPIQAIPDGEGKEGWDQEQFLYFSEALGMALIDMEQDGMRGSTVNNMLGSIDMSQVQDVQFYLQLLEFIRREWDQLLGITEPRKGTQPASQGLGVTQQSLAQSNAITERLFTSFEHFEERLMMQMLDASKFAYIDGKKAQLLNDDTSREFLNVDPEEHVNADYDLFVTSSAKETEKIRYLREIAVGAASQQQQLSKVVELVEGDNFAKIKTILQEMEQREVEMAERQQEIQSQNEVQAAQAQAQAEKERMQIAEEFRQYERDFESFLQDRKYEHEKDIELIKLGAKDENMNNVLDVNEAEKSQLERDKMRMQEAREASKASMDYDIKNKELALKAKEHATNERLRKLEIKAKEADTKAKITIAKTNKNRYDK